MESVWNHYYIIIKRSLAFVGQWPYQERRTRLFRTSFLTATIISMMIPQVGRIIQCDGDMRCISLTVPSDLATIIILIKLYTCHFNNSKIKDLTDHLCSDWKEFQGAEESEIMKTYAANARWFSFAYCIYYYTAAGTFVLVSLVPHVINVILPVNESWPIFMPYEAYYFVDGERYFFYIFFHVLVSIEISMTAVIAHDCMLLVYIEHACSIFTVAGFRFEIVSRNDRRDAMNNSLHDTYNRKIAASVYAHWRALQFAELLEKTFCISFAVQIMIVTVAMSITLLQVVLELHEFAQATRYIAFVISQLIHLFCYSLQGQKLIDHSVQIREKIYNSCWYDILAKSQKMLLYVMRRSMQPNFLSAGKIYVFSLKSFTTVVQSSVSYFTVLASFQ